MLEDGPENILLSRIPLIVYKIEQKIKNMPDSKKDELSQRFKDTLIEIKPFLDDLDYYLDSPPDKQ